MSSGPTYTYKRAGFRLDVYPNRIEVFKGALVSRKDTILIRSIIDLDVRRVTGILKIKTIDNKTHDFIIGVEAEAVRQAILAYL